MKIISTTLLAISLLIFTKCSKNVGFSETGVQLRFIHASPNAAAIIFSLNNKEAFKPALSYKDTTAYLPFTGGTYNVQIVTAAKTPVNTVIDFRPGKTYSLFAIDSANRLQLSVVTDDLTVPATPLRTRLRFLNYVPNAGSLNVAGISGADTVALFNGRTFNQSSTAPAIAEFTQFPSGIYKLILYDANNLIQATVNMATLRPYKTYTLFARGFIGGSGSQAVALTILPNN